MWRIKHDFLRGYREKKKEKDAGDLLEVWRVQTPHGEEEEDETNIMIRQNQLFNKCQQLFMFFYFFLNTILHSESKYYYKKKIILQLQISLLSRALKFLNPRAV